MPSGQARAVLRARNRGMRDELLAREAFDTLLETQVLAERYRKYYNTVRPHSALGYQPPAPEAILPRGASPEGRAVYQGLT